MAGTTVSTHGKLAKGQGIVFVVLCHLIVVVRTESENGGG